MLPAMGTGSSHPVVRHAALVLPPGQVRARIWQLEGDKNAAVERADYAAAAQYGTQISMLQRRRQSETAGTPEEHRLPYPHAEVHQGQQQEEEERPQSPSVDQESSAGNMRREDAEDSSVFGGLFSIPSIEMLSVGLGGVNVFGNGGGNESSETEEEDDAHEKEGGMFGLFASFRHHYINSEIPPVQSQLGHDDDDSETETCDYGGPATAKGLLANGGTAALAAYLETNPDQTSRIQEELAGVSLLGNGMPGKEKEEALTSSTPLPPPQRVLACQHCGRCVSANATAPELLQQGGSKALSCYLEVHPDKATKIQREMADSPLLSIVNSAASQHTEIFYGEM